MITPHPPEINPLILFYNPGVSDESITLGSIYDEFIQGIGKTTSGQRIIPMVNDLVEVFNECLEEGWDGYDAQPISIGAYSDALTFLQLLPTSSPPPDVVPEPDSSIGLEWSNQESSRFLVSFDGSGTFAYAGIFSGGNNTHGIESIKDSFPRAIQDFINRLYLKYI